MHGMISTYFIISQSFIFRRIRVLVTKHYQAYTYKLDPSLYLRGVWSKSNLISFSMFWSEVAAALAVSYYYFFFLRFLFLFFLFAFAGFALFCCKS